MSGRRNFILGTTTALLLAPEMARGDSHAQLVSGREPHNPNAMSPEERLHCPALTMPDRVHPGRAFDLVVRIGVDVHPMDAAHHIERVEVELDGVLAWAADLSARVPFSVVRIPLMLAADATHAALAVRARCNVHGVWLTRRDLELA